jgi:uncharacterized RDD family membrane protein YckC
MSQPPESDGELPPLEPPVAPSPPPPMAPPPPPFPPQAPPTAGYGQAPYGQAPPPPGMYIDYLSGLALPEGTELAPAGRRIGAFFLSIPLAIVTLGIGYAVWGLIVWGRGQTPALQVLGMRCWRPETGRVASWGWMAFREIIGRIVEGIVITALVSFILMLTSKNRKTLHDLIAGTVVLRDPNKVLTTK